MVSKIISRITLNDGWQAVDLKNLNDCYLIAIKEKATKHDTIEASIVKQVRFELGIDSGIKGQPLTVQYVTLNFSDITSGNNALNKITAFTRLVNVPNQFYIKAVSIDDGHKEIKEGTTSISVNVNAVDLG